jgi:hypothetical protein
MSGENGIVCRRFAFIDSEYDARVGTGEPPGSPICFCAIEVDEDGNVTEHRLTAPYPAKPTWDRGEPFLTVGFALGLRPAAYCTSAGHSRVQRSTSTRNTW